MLIEASISSKEGLFELVVDHIMQDTNIETFLN